MLMRWLRDYRIPILLFFGNRAALFVMAWVSLFWVPYTPARWHIDNALLDGWYRWDSGWYSQIVENGYRNIPSSLGERDVVFFPLYPLLVKLLFKLTGDMALSGVIVSNVALFGATLMFYKLVQEREDAGAAWRSTLLLLCYPYSFFLSAMYTEATFLFGVVLAFFAAQRKSWFFAAVGAAIAGGTRSIGVLATFGIFLAYLEQIRFRVRSIRPNILLIGFGLAGTLGYMFYLWYRWRTPLVFTTNLNVAVWGGDMTLRRAWDILSGPFLDWKGWHASEMPYWLSLFTLVVAFVLCLAGSWRLGIAYTVWTLLTLLVYARVWVGTARFLTYNFPMFMIVGIWSARKPVAFHLLLLVSILLLMMLLFGFTHGLWVS